MAQVQVKRALLPAMAGALLVAAFCAAFAVQPAYASTRDDLTNNYQSAVLNYESVLTQQDQNEGEIAQVEADIADNERKVGLTEEQIGDTAVSMYKGTRGNWVIVDLVLESSSFSDAVARFEKYEKIEEYYREKIDELERARARLDAEAERLQQRKAELEAEAAEAKLAAEAAALALLDNTHTDGAQFHQLQGNGSNCGATAFIVSVNTILHENRYPDNVAVWSSASFNSDSTADIAWKGANWLNANALQDLISIETVPGDIHSAADMRAWLEEGYVLVISSGPGSVFQHADGGSAAQGSYPDGHYIMFYCYDNGVYYANDSAVSAVQGAGAPYTEDQMQQWLSGRENHFAVALKKR